MLKFCRVCVSGTIELPPCGVVNVTALSNRSEMLLTLERNRPPQISSAYSTLLPAGRFKKAAELFFV